MCVYLLHISPPLGHARHYTGWTSDTSPGRRLATHQKGKGSKMLAAAVRSGRSLELVCHWPEGDRKFEAWLKRRGDTKQWCPACGVNSRPMPRAEGMKFDGRTKRQRRDQRAKNDREDGMHT